LFLGESSEKRGSGGAEKRVRCCERKGGKRGKRMV